MPDNVLGPTQSEAVKFVDVISNAVNNDPNNSRQHHKLLHFIEDTAGTLIMEFGIRELQ
jgi:hypothetical protein